MSAPNSRPSWLAGPLGWLLAAALGAVAVRWIAPPVAAASTDNGERYVAVAGLYQEGVSLLYVLDQKTQHLAVYEARGGAPNSREVVFIGARDISLDTLLPAFNDESEYTFKQLKEEFEKREIPLFEEGLDSSDGD